MPFVATVKKKGKKKRKIWKNTHSDLYFLYQCEWKSTIAREYLYTVSHTDKCWHSTCLLWLVHSSKLSFPGPFEKDFPPLFFFSTHRLDQLQPYSESLSQPKQTVVCSTSFTLPWRRGLWAATSHSLHASSASGLNYFDKGTSKCVDGYVWNCMCVLKYLSSSFSLPWHCDHIQTNYASLAFKM